MAVVTVTMILSPQASQESLQPLVNPWVIERVDNKDPSRTEGNSIERKMSHGSGGAGNIRIFTNTDSFSR